MENETGKSKSFFEELSLKVTKAVGSTAAFSIALLLVIGWAITGPFFNFSETEIQEISGLELGWSLQNRVLCLEQRARIFV